VARLIFGFAPGYGIRHCSERRHAGFGQGRAPGEAARRRYCGRANVQGVTFCGPYHFVEGNMVDGLHLARGPFNICLDVADPADNT
jgi:hypothetical protein